MTIKTNLDDRKELAKRLDVTFSTLRRWLADSMTYQQPRRNAS